jgi:hypothetical protein
LVYNFGEVDLLNRLGYRRDLVEVF